jgi:hypothetical protein
MHQHYFYNASQTLAVNSGDELVPYVWTDPASPPSEIMLQWCSAEEGFNHRAYWKANLIGWGTDCHYRRAIVARCRIRANGCGWQCQRASSGWRARRCMGWPLRYSMERQGGTTPGSAAPRTSIRLG